MAGITSVITLEDRFSGTIKLFTKLITGSFKPTDLFSMNLGKMASTAASLAGKVVTLYPKFDTLKDVMQISSFGLAGLIEKFGNIQGVIMKVSNVFPALQPLATILQGIFLRARDGSSLFDQLAHVVADLNLPFSGLVNTFLKIKAFMQGAGGKIIKLIATIAAVSLALKGVLAVGNLLEKNIPKAFAAVKNSAISMLGKLTGASDTIEIAGQPNGVFGKYKKIATETFGKVKQSIGPFTEKLKSGLGTAKGALTSFRESSGKIFEKLKWNFHVYSWTAKWYLQRAADRIKDTAAYQFAAKHLTVFKDKATAIWNKYSAVVSKYTDKAVTYIKRTKAYQYASQYVSKYVEQAKAEWAKQSEVVKKYTNKAAEYIKGTKAYQYASQYITKYTGVAKEQWAKYSDVAKKVLSKFAGAAKDYTIKAGEYLKNTKVFQGAKAFISRTFSDGLGGAFKLALSNTKTFFKNFKNEFSWGWLRAKVAMFNIKEAIKESSAYKVASQKISAFMTFAKGRWAWYSGTVKMRLKQVTDYIKGTKAYQYLAEKYNMYMDKLKNSAAYQAAKTALTGFVTSAKAKLISLAITAKATAIAQAGMLKSMILEHGFFAGISKYIAYLKLMGKEFLITKLIALKTFLLTKLSALKTFIVTKITATSAFQTIKKGVITVFQTVKMWWGRIPGVVKAAFAVYGIISGIKAIKAAFDALGNTLDNWKEKVNDLIEKTNSMEKATRRSIQMGEEVNNAFTKMATRISIETGVAKNDILEFNTALHKIGVGNATNKALADLAVRFSTLNENMDFSSVSSALTEAIKQGSSDGLEQLLGGNPLARVKFRRMRLDRMLRRGDVEGFIKSFSAIADQFGYTQEKAKQLQNTTQGKLKQIGGHIDRLSEKVKSVYISKIEPYVDKFLDFISSKEFQMQFQQITSRFGAMLDMAGVFISKLVDVGLAIYKWWIEPTGGALRNIMLFISSALAIGKVVSILAGFKFIGPVFAKVFGIATLGVKGLINGIKGAMDAKARFDQGGVGAVFRSDMEKNESAVKRFGRRVATVAKAAGKAIRAVSLSPGVALTTTALITGNAMKMIHHEITGESKGAVESTIEIFVAGTTTAIGNLAQMMEKAANSIGEFFFDIKKTVENAIIDSINFLIEKYQSLVNTINRLMPGDRPEIRYKKLLRNETVYKGIHVTTDDEIYNLAKARVDQAMSYIPDIMKAKDTAEALMGLKDPAEYAKEFEDLFKPLNEELNNENDILGGIKYNTDSMRQKMDLRWMKELAEQRFVNNVNIKQMVPTVNVKVSGSKITPQDTADALAKELSQMADAGAFNAYGGKV